MMKCPLDEMGLDEMSWILYGPPSYECGEGSVMHGYNMPALEREIFKRLDLGVHKI